MSRPLTLSYLPLFPLGTVLFPGGVLSLRVFEVRYLDMVRKCHQAGAPFGVVALQQGSEVRQAGAPQEELYEVGTLATIDHLKIVQPGLVLLQCHGTARFRVTRRNRLPHGLWIADVEQWADDATVAIPPDLQHIAVALTQVLVQLRERDIDGTPLPSPTTAQLDDCSWVANRWCELLPVPLPLKQQLMSLENPLLRLELVGDVLVKTGISISRDRRKRLF